MEAIAARTIAAKAECIASVMFNPRRDPEWIGGARSVEPPVGDPTAIGSRVTRHGGFMGRKFSWQTEVEEYRPNRLLRMRFIQGPMKGGDVTYEIVPQNGRCRVSIRNRGPGPRILVWFVQRSVARDLNRLAKLTE